VLSSFLILPNQLLRNGSETGLGEEDSHRNLLRCEILTELFFEPCFALSPRGNLELVLKEKKIE
jgi:hypothetical protein